MNWDTEEADVLIVGGGAAGCSAALAAAEKGLRVILLCKEVFGKAQTLMASEGYAGVFARGDRWKDHFIDTLNAGGWINNQTLVEVLTKESSKCLLELEEHGALLDRLPDGNLALRSFSGHTTPRVCTAHDEIGHVIMTTLVEDIRRLQVRVVEEFYVTQLILKNGVTVGASGIHTPTGNYAVYPAKATILATGGAGRLFEVTSNSRNSTGDGYALALKAGARFVDMEMMLFHPTAFVYPESQRGIVISEAVRVIGGVLHNKNKDRFMEKYNAAFKDLAPSSETARAILTEIEDGRAGRHGGVYLDFSSVNRADVETFLPYTLTRILEAGFDVQQHPPEVAPTAHCLLGGVVVNENGETGVPGLYAVGDVAGGIHGAGMLPGNALAAALVFGRRAGVASSEWALKTPPPTVDGEHVDADVKRVYGLLEDRSGPRASVLRKQLQAAMWNNCGPTRSRHGLNSVLEQIAKWRSAASSSLIVENKSPRHNREWIEALELENMLMVAEAMVKSALERRESRGVHYRIDHPRLSNQQYFVNIQARQLNGEIVVESHPVAVRYVTQPGGEFTEGEPR